MTRWDCKDTDRDAIIHELMLDAGMTDVPELADSLKALESFASMPAPVPGAALAAMLAGPGAATVAGSGSITVAAGAGAGAAAAGTVVGDRALPLDELSKRRQSRRHRPAVIGAAVLTAMGLGVGGVAASTSGFSKGTPDFMQVLISGWAPGWTTAPPSLVPPLPRQDSPKVTTSPAPVAPPAPAVEPVPAIPAAPEKAAPPAADPSAADPSAAEGAPSPVESKGVKDSTKNGAAGQPRATKPGGAEPKTDSQGGLKQTTDTVPKLPGKELQDGLHQAPQDGKNGLGTQSPGSSLRWLLGLDR